MPCRSRVASPPRPGAGRGEGGIGSLGRLHKYALGSRFFAVAKLTKGLHLNWPADKVERWPLDRLIPYARNARTHSDEQVAQIAASIKEWGWTNPVLVDEGGQIIAGHGRVSAARTLGLKDAPVMVAAGWTDAQKRAYVLADNKLALNAEWDVELLQVELQELHEADFQMSLIGFSAPDLAVAMGLGAEFAPGTQDDQSSLDQKAPTICPACGHEFHP
jgi:hypothetical protein